MRYEVHAISNVTENLLRNRTAEEIAKDIENAYATAARRGGKIIASHTLQRDIPTDGGMLNGGEHLMLVAEMPGAAPLEP